MSTTVWERKTYQKKTLMEKVIQKNGTWKAASPCHQWRYPAWDSHRSCWDCRRSGWSGACWPPRMSKWCWRRREEEGKKDWGDFFKKKNHFPILNVTLKKTTWKSRRQDAYGVVVLTVFKISRIMTISWFMMLGNWPSLSPTERKHKRFAVDCLIGWSWMASPLIGWSWMGLPLIGWLVDRGCLRSTNDEDDQLNGIKPLTITVEHDVVGVRAVGFLEFLHDVCRGGGGSNQFETIAVCDESANGKKLTLDQFGHDTVHRIVVIGKVHEIHVGRHVAIPWGARRHGRPLFHAVAMHVDAHNRGRSRKSKLFWTRKKE